MRAPRQRRIFTGRRRYHGALVQAGKLAAGMLAVLLVRFLVG